MSDFTHISNILPDVLKDISEGNFDRLIEKKYLDKWDNENRIVEKHFSMIAEQKLTNVEA